MQHNTLASLSLGQEHTDTINSHPATLGNGVGPSRVQRMHTPLANFDESLYYKAHVVDPISTLTPCQKDSSRTHYPLKDYVTFTKYFPTCQQFLVASTKVVELRFHPEVVKDE